MRKWNAVISGLMLILFLAHAIMGGMELIGLYEGLNTIVSKIAWALLFLVFLHLVIGIKLTVDTLSACKKSGISYFKENKLFWVRRISGFAIALFIVFHVIIFMGRETGNGYRLHFFGMAELITQIFLVLSIALHVLANLKPSLIAFGIKEWKEYAADILFVLSVFLIFMGIAFFIYYMRWG